MKDAIDAMKHLNNICLNMAEDEGLWIEAQTASEAYIQHALRRLCNEIEGEYALIESQNKE